MSAGLTQSPSPRGSAPLAEDVDGAAEVTAVLSGLPEYLQKAGEKLPQLYARRTGDPAAAAEAAVGLQKLGIQAMDFHEARGYALLGYSGEAALAAGDRLEAAQAAQMFYNAACANGWIG
ncbi:MAG: hypothetical protein AAF907_01315, partial [Planctomycetota bacterium]